MNTDMLFIDGYELPTPLPDKEVNDLLNKAQQGDVSSKKRLAEHNIRLVLSEVYGKFKNTNYDKKELLPIGIIGLMRAITTFDFTRGVVFSTYAVTYIDNEIKMFLRKEQKDKNIDSLDRAINDTDGKEQKLQDVLIDDQNFIDDYMKKETYHIIRKMVNELPERDRMIVTMYFGFCNNKRYSQKEIAERFKISISYVSRTIKKDVNIIGNRLHEQGIIELKGTPIKKTRVKKDGTKRKQRKKERKAMIVNFNNNEITKNDYLKMLVILKTPILKKMMSVFSPKEVMIASLKLGCIDGKCFSTTAISQFLGVSSQEVIDTTKIILLAYKDNVNEFVKGIREQVSEEIIITDKLQYKKLKK